MMNTHGYAVMQIAHIVQTLFIVAAIFMRGKQMKPYVDILGTRYRIEVRKISEDKIMEEKQWDGFCSEYLKLIVVADVTEAKYFGETTEEERKNVKNAILRHEIIHAFLNESGLSSNANCFGDAWAKNEEMVDWISIQAPKIAEAYRWCECM